ncbi:hypothetical protein ACN6AT_37115 (plasmid) [Streptomyces sp. JL4002]|uniref:hypothetical protein n=1 Tax=Streptomyces sp. JL4002 TaxID=3404781 RepID=UPI003B287107
MAFEANVPPDAANFVSQSQLFAQSSANADQSVLNDIKKNDPVSLRKDYFAAYLSALEGLGWTTEGLYMYEWPPDPAKHTYQVPLAFIDMLSAMKARGGFAADILSSAIATLIQYNATDANPSTKNAWENQTNFASGGKWMQGATSWLPASDSSKAQINISLGTCYWSTTEKVTDKFWDPLHSVDTEFYIGTTGITCQWPLASVGADLVEQKFATNNASLIIPLPLSSTPLESVVSDLLDRA